jgi:hypothetical protein
MCLAKAGWQYHSLCMSDDQTAAYKAHCDPQLIRALCGKYEKLCDLRQRQSSVAPRAELVALAAGFPGALRELDCLALEELDRRLLALRAVVDGRANIERWMVLQIAYHGCMRAVLRIRRLLLEQERRAHATGMTEPQSLAFEPAPDEPALERFDAQDLALIRKPPRGRLNPWVLARVARDHGVTVVCIESALWGATKSAFP